MTDLPRKRIVPLIFSGAAFQRDPAGFGTWSQAFAWRLPWFHRASPSTTLDKMVCGIVAGLRSVKGKIRPISDRATAFSRVEWLGVPMDLSRFQNSEFSRGAPAWKEALWWVVRSVLFAPWFPVPSGLKCAALRAFGSKVGKGVVIRSRVNITFPWRVEIGDHVWIGDEVLILSLAPVRIGRSVCLSQRVFLCTGSHDFRSEAFDLVVKPIEIGEGSWIAAGVFVGPGVVIGKNTLCAAGAVVVKYAGPDAMVAGNPARPIGRS